MKQLRSDDNDFTIDAYRELLVLLEKSYTVCSYSEIPFGTKFALWRHDIDYSLNRSLRLAKIEAAVGIQSTYFVDPHSPYYNVHEKSQRDKLREILEMGHHLGLHFDAHFHSVKTESELEKFVRQDAEALLGLTGSSVVAMSFHNPTELHLRWKRDFYGGVANAYSERIMNEVPYVSDSNGYWRFRRLHDVLEKAEDSCLQVLTHPGWWQEKAMSPGMRVHRAIQGRATSVMSNHELSLQSFGRTNFSSLPGSVEALAQRLGPKFKLVGYLWNEEIFDTLFIELWRLHEKQINNLCKALFRKIWRVPASETQAFFASEGVSLDGWRLFEAVFEQSWQAAVMSDAQEHKQWASVRNNVIHGRESMKPAELKQGCEYLGTVISALQIWGLEQEFNFDGISPLGSLGLPTLITAEGSLIDELGPKLQDDDSRESSRHRKQWRQLEERIRALKFEVG
jgi:hypothetical protein